MRNSCALLLVLLVALAGNVRAQEPTADQRVARGAELYQADKPLEAAAEWEKALVELGESGWKIHYNLGLAYEAAADATRAAEHFEAFLRRVAAEAAALPTELEERREDAAFRLSALKAAHGAIVLPPQPVAIMVRIDDGPPRPAGFTAYLTPGKHRLVVVGPRGAERQQTVEVAQGATLRADTTDPTPPVTPPRPRRPAPIKKEEPPAREFPIALVLVGAGLTVLSFAAPIALWHVAAGKYRDANALGTGHSDYPAAREAYNNARTAYLASYAAPAALGAVTIGIAIWGGVHVAQDPKNAALVVSGRF